MSNLKKKEICTVKTKNSMNVLSKMCSLPHIFLKIVFFSFNFIFLALHNFHWSTYTIVVILRRGGGVVEQIHPCMLNKWSNCYTCIIKLWKRIDCQKYGRGGAMNLNVLIQEDTNSKLSNTFIMKISYTIFLINKKEKKPLW